MALDWMQDIEKLPVETLLLLEECQLGWISRDYLREEYAAVFRAHPDIAWYFAHKRPDMAGWVSDIQKIETDMPVEIAAGRVLKSMEDWIVYAVDPDVYQNQSFVGWDETELTGILDFTGKRVIDIGSGTGKQAFAVARLCKSVYCVEPVANLRKYLRARALREGRMGVRVVDGFLENLPFEDDFADVTMGGHIYGDNPKAEIDEMSRVTRPGGTVILIPGLSDRDCPEHDYLINRGFSWGRFLEPGDGVKRKYWLTITK